MTDIANIYIIIGQCASDPTKAAINISPTMGAATPSTSRPIPSKFTPWNDSIYITTTVFTAVIPKRAAVIDIISANLTGCGIPHRLTQLHRAHRQRRADHPDTIVGLTYDPLLIKLVRFCISGLSIRLIMNTPQTAVVEIAVDKNTINTLMSEARPISLDDSAIVLVSYEGITMHRLPEDKSSEGSLLT